MRQGVPKPAHVFNIHSTALAASLLLITAAFVAAAASSKYNHTKRHRGVVPYNWFPAAEPLHHKCEFIEETKKLENKMQIGPEHQQTN